MLPERSRSGGDVSQPDLLTHVRRMDHLGLVAGVARKIRLVETIDLTFRNSEFEIPEFF